MTYADFRRRLQPWVSLAEAAAIAAELGYRLAPAGLRLVLVPL